MRISRVSESYKYGMQSVYRVLVLLRSFVVSSVYVARQRNHKTREVAKVWGMRSAYPEESVERAMLEPEMLSWSWGREQQVGTLAVPIQ